MQNFDVFTGQTTLLTAAFIYLTICFLVAYFLGRKRQVGFLMTMFFSVLLTPIVGAIFAMYSKKLPGEHM